MPIISGEWGYSNINWDKKRLSNEKQAQYLVREFLINLYQEIPVSIWYDWKNDGTNPDEREHHFGTVMHDLRPKEAYIATKCLCLNLAGFSVEKRLDLPNKNDFALLLTKGPRKAAAVWTTEDKHEITLLLPAGKGTLIDMLGNKKEITWHNDALKLTISQAPQYMLIQRD